MGKKTAWASVWGFTVLVSGLLCSGGEDRTVSGRILDYRTDRPVEGVTVRTLPPSRQVCTDPDGRYKISGLAEGISYTVIAGKKGYRVYHQDLSPRIMMMTCDIPLPPDERVETPVRCLPRLPTSADFRLSIGGLVIDWTTDLPVAGAVIRTVPPTETVETDALGAYFIHRNVREGEYNITAEKIGYGLHQPDGYPIRVSAGSMTRCDMPMLLEAESAIQRRFRLAAGQRELIPLEIKSPCVIEAVAEWTGTAKNLSFILNGPGQTGYYARENGKSPLWIIYRITKGELLAGGKWTLSLVNFLTRESAQCDVRINLKYR